MRSTFLALTMVGALLGGCQSGPTPGMQMATAGLAGAKPATPDEDARFLAAGARLNRSTPMHVAASFDPTGLSQNVAQAASRPDMNELQRLMPAMSARNKQRVEEMCASNRQMPECREYEKLKREARAAGAQF